jgi:hypothetical protein
MTLKREWLDKIMNGNSENKSILYYENSGLHSPVDNINKLFRITLKIVRELFLCLASTQFNLAPQGDSRKGIAEDKVAVCRCNTDAEIRAAVTWTSRVKKPKRHGRYNYRRGDVPGSVPSIRLPTWIRWTHKNTGGMN